MVAVDITTEHQGSIRGQLLVTRQGGYMYTQGWAAYPIAFPSVCLYANSVAYSGDWDYHDSMRNTTGLTIYGDGYNKLFLAVGY